MHDCYKFEECEYNSQPKCSEIKMQEPMITGSGAARRRNDMERLTNDSPCKYCNKNRKEDDSYPWIMPCYNCQERFEWMTKQLICLSLIKNILGDDYDLSRLRELVQADRDGRCVVNGEWLYAETDDEQFFLCSVCNNKEYWESNYCPECGAKMDEEQEE